MTSRNSNPGAPPSLTWLFFMGIFERTHTHTRIQSLTHSLNVHEFFLSCEISGFRRDVIEIFTLLGCYAALVDILLGTVLVSYYSFPSSHLVQFRLHCCWEMYVLCVSWMPKSTNKKANVSTCRCNELRTLNKRVIVYPEIILKLSKGYRGNFSDKNLWSCILGARSGISNLRLLRGDYPSAVLWFISELNDRIKLFSRDSWSMMLDI
jgi:hypothetical protein